MLVLTVSIIAAWLIFKKYYLLEMVHTKIEQSIDENIENEFQFTLDDLSVNFFTSGVQFNGLKFHLLNKTDTVGYFKGDILVDVKGWRNLLFDNKKKINDIALRNSQMYYSGDYPLVINEKEGSGDQQFEIANTSAAGNLRFADKHKHQEGQLVVDFEFNIALDYNNENELNTNDLINQITGFQLSNLHYYLPDGFYQLKIAEASFDEFEDIMVKQITVNPIYTRKQFALKKKVATDYIAASIDSVRLLAFDSRVNERVYIDQINISGPSIDVYKDKNPPDDEEYTAILVDLLKELKTPVYIRTVDVNEMFIKYTELAEDAAEPGELFFSRAKANIKNITNVEDSVRESGSMEIEAQAEFYGEGTLNASFNYELLSEPGRFNIKGSLKPMDITKANAIISKLAPLKIESGRVDKILFNFAGTRNHSKGEMWFEYSNLNIEILEVKYWDSRFTRSVASSVGNVVLRNTNPASNGVFRVGEINQDRDTAKSMFNFWWICLRSGFLSTLGVTEEKQEINYESGQEATFLDKPGLSD